MQRMKLQKLSESNEPDTGAYTIFDSTYILVEGKIVKDGKEVGYGRLKVLAEAIVVLEATESFTTRVKTLKFAVEECIKEARENGLQQVHLFPTDARFANILKNHFGFEDVVGIPLVLELRDNGEESKTKQD